MKPLEPLELELKLGMESMKPREQMEQMEQKLKLGFASMKCP